jgi:hypothetical protein
LETVKISFDIETSDAECPLGVEIWLDDTVLLTNNHVQEKICFSYNISDDDGEHQLRVVMSGKTSEHTRVDEAGNIVKDVTLQISNVVIDDLDVNQLFLEKCVYTHNFNDTQPEIADTFHGVAGCNGTISFEFTTPIYLWLLENM